jgi:hypothetical protein
MFTDENKSRWMMTGFVNRLTGEMAMSGTNNGGKSYDVTYGMICTATKLF